MIKIIKYFIQAFFIYLFFLIGKLIGIKYGRALFSFIFKKIGPLIKSKKILDSNISKFEDATSKNLKYKIIPNMWSNYGMTFIEYVFLNHLRKDNLNIEIKGEKILDDIFTTNKPVVFVSGHFANFELMSMQITKKNIKLATIYRPLNNYFLNPFMEFLRRKFICKNQIKKGHSGTKDIINFIKNNHSIALMIDQRVSEGEKVDFFNKKALTTTLPAQISVKFNLDIVPVFIERTNKNKFIMEVYKPIQAYKLKNKIEITQQLNEILEEMIIKNPNQWIWTHDRWK